MDFISNKVAEAVFNDIAEGTNERPAWTLPSLEEVGEKDANTVIAGAFGAQEGAWSGNPLFIALGEYSFYEKNIIQSGNGFYDFAAMMASSYAALGSVSSLPSLVADVHATLGANDIGFWDTFGLGMQATADANRLLNENYGISWARFITLNLMVGTLNIENEIHGTNQNDFIIGGKKDDVFYSLFGSNIIDGGEGFDTVDYSLSSVAIIFDSGQQQKGRSVPFVVTDFIGATADHLYSIEKVVGSTYGDLFLINPSANADMQELTLDGGEGRDTISFANAARGVNTGPGQSLTFTNFEHVIGSEHGDVLDLRNLSPGGALTAEQRAQIAAAWALPLDSFADPAAFFRSALARVEAAMAVPQNGIEVVIEGGAGKDDITGSETGYNIIHGGAGMNTLRAGGFVSELHGGDDGNILIAGGMMSQLYGGSGKDHFVLSNNAFVMNADSNDVISWGSHRLTGGVQQWWMEGGWAY